MPITRALFVHVAQGRYQFNPKLLVRRKQGDAEVWMPVLQALNLPFIGEFAWDFVWERIDQYLALGNLPERTISVAAERIIARRAAEVREWEKRQAEERAALEHWRAEQQAAKQRGENVHPKWGTPEAKRREIERLRKEIEDRKKG